MAYYNIGDSTIEKLIDLKLKDNVKYETRLKALKEIVIDLIDVNWEVEKAIKEKIKENSLSGVV